MLWVIRLNTGIILTWPLCRLDLLLGITSLVCFFFIFFCLHLQKNLLGDVCHKQPLNFKNTKNNNKTSCNLFFLSHLYSLDELPCRQPKSLHRPSKKRVLKNSVKQNNITTFFKLEMCLALKAAALGKITRHSVFENLF